MNQLVPTTDVKIKLTWWDDPISVSFTRFIQPSLGFSRHPPSMRQDIGEELGKGDASHTFRDISYCSSRTA
jgi:hypothetical protein